MDDFLSTIAKLTGNKSLVSEPKIDVNPILDRMRDSVVTQESGGRQKIKNPRTGATGLFQVLPSNIPNWTKKYLGKSLTPEQYANDPDAQEKVFRGEMGRYLEKALRTSPDEDTAIRKAAAAWYGGEGAMHRYDDPKRFRPDEPSFQEYTNSILGRLKQKPQTDTPDFLSSLQDLTKDLGGEDFLSRIQKIAPSPTNPVNPPKVNIPAPEAPETINAQIQSTLDPNSPKKGTLLTPGEQIPTLGGLQVIDVPEGKLAVNPAKGQPQSLAEAIGKVQDVGSNTRGMTVLTTDAQGNELSASIVRDPKAAAEQVKLDKQMYPQAVNHELLPSEEVARRRAEITRNPFQSPDARQFPWSMMLPNEMPETQESIRNKREWEKWGPVYRQFLVDEKLEDSPEALKRFNTKMQALSATQREKTRKVARKSNLDAQVGSEEKTYKFDETGVLALENGKKLFVDNSKEVPVDTTRFRDDEGETYLFDRTTGKLQDESLSDIADTFPVSRVPYTQKATTPLRQAQEHRAVQVARALATKYGMNEDDVYQWVMQRGFTDPEASKAQGRDVPLPEDRYYESDAQGLIRNQTNYNRQGSSIGAPGTKPPTGEISSSDTHSLTRRQMRELEAFTSEQKAKREQAVLKMISEGREPDAETLRSLGVSLDELRSKQYDEFEMARVKGRVNQADIDRFKAEYRSQGNDERLAELKALQRKGIGGKEVSTEIANYENRRREIAEEVRKYGGLFKEGGYAEKKYGYAPQTQTPEDIDRKVNAQIAKEIQAYGSITAFVNKQKKAEAEERARIERIKNDPTSKKVFEYVKGYSAGVAGSAVEGIGDLVKGFPIWTKPVADYIDSLFGTNHRDLKNHPFTQLGQGIKDAGQFIKDWQSRDYQKEFWAGSVPQGLGSSIAFMPAAAGGPLGISLFATMQMTGSSYDEAIEAGAKPETAEKYGRLVGGLLGWTERFGLGESWQRLIKGQGGKRIKGILLDALKESAEEVFVNELPQSLGQNYLAKLTFDPARQWDKDLADSLGAAGVSAPVASILISGLLHIKHRRQIAQVVKDDMVNGGPLVRDFGEGGVFVSGKQIQVTKELEPLLQKHREYQKEIQTGFDDIKEAKKRKEAAKFNDKPRYDRIIDDIRREQFRVMLEQQKVAGAIARLSGSVPSIVEQKESAEKQTQTQRITLKPLNETKAPTPQKSAPVAQTPLAKDTPVESKAEPKSVESLLKYYEEAPTDLIPEAPLRPSEKGFEIVSETGAKATTPVGQLKEQRDEERRKGNTDKLTGLANQNAWEAAKERIESDPEQEVISIDVNRMKDVNDTTSHEGVNKTVLKPIGDAVQKVLTKHGIDSRNGFRTGGDEFTIAVPKGKAQQVRDDIEKAFGVVNVTAEKDFTNTRTGESFKKGDVIPVTISGSFGNTVKEAEVELGKRKEESKKANPVNRDTNRDKMSQSVKGDIKTEEVSQAPSAGTKSVPETPVSQKSGQEDIRDKQPWEMTREEFAESQKKATDNKYVQQQRDAIVRQAVKQGKPVPAEVLADYPDLTNNPTEELKTAETMANLLFHVANAAQSKRTATKIIAQFGREAYDNARKHQWILMPAKGPSGPHVISKIGRDQLRELNNQMGDLRKAATSTAKVTQESAKVQAESKPQTETNNDIEALPPSQRVTPEDLQDDVTFKAVESASLEMPADSGSFKLQEDAQFAHPQDLLDRAKSSITDDGHIELNVEAGELLRRIAGKSNLFFALTHKKGTLIQLARKIDRKLDEFRKAGYSDAEIKVLSDLADQLREIAKSGAGVTYIFDFALPHETHHQMVLNALGDNVFPEESVDELSKLDVWKNPKVKQPTGQVSTFNKLYPNARGVTKAFEIAAMLDTGEIQSKDKERFLQIFAQGIRKASPEINEANFARIFQYDSTPSNARGDTETGSERQEDRSTGENDKGKLTQEEAGEEAVSRPSDGDIQRPDSGAAAETGEKVRQAVTHAEREGVVGVNEITGTARYYTVKSSDARTLRAQNKIEKIGLDAAILEASQPITDLKNADEQNVFQIETVHLLNRLADTATRNGDIPLAQLRTAQRKQIMEVIAKQGTPAGRLVQSFTQLTSKENRDTIREYVDAKRRQQGWDVPQTEEEAKALADAFDKLKAAEDRVAELERLLEKASRKPTKSQKTLLKVLFDNANAAKARLQDIGSLEMPAGDAIPLSLHGQVLSDLSDIGAAILYDGFNEEDILTPEQFEKEFNKQTKNRYAENWRQVHAESLAKLKQLRKDIATANKVAELKADNPDITPEEITKELKAEEAKQKERTKIRREHTKLANEVLGTIRKGEKGIAKDEAKKKAEQDKVTEFLRTAYQVNPEIDEQVLTTAILLNRHTNLTTSDASKLLREIYPELEIKGNAKEKKVIFAKVNDLLAKGRKLQLDVRRAQKDQALRNRGLDPEQHRKQLAEAKAERRDAQSGFDELIHKQSQPPATVTQKIAQLQRMAMVSAINTAANNLASGVATRGQFRVVDAIDAAIQKVAKKLKVELKDEGVTADTRFWDIVGYNKTEGGAKNWLKDLTSAHSLVLQAINDHPELFNELYGDYSSDITTDDLKGEGLIHGALDGGIYAFDKLNFANRWQEYFVRDLEVLYALQLRLGQRGINISDAHSQEDYSQLTAEDWKFAIKRARSVTYALRPEAGTVAKRVLDTMNNKYMSLPTALILPFAKFSWNAWNMTRNWMPVIAQIRAGRRVASEEGKTVRDLFDPKNYTSREMANSVFGFVMLGAMIGLTRALGDRDDWYYLKIPGTNGMGRNGSALYVDVRQHPQLVPFVYLGNKFNRLIDGKEVFNYNDPSFIAGELGEAFLSVSYRQAVDNNTGLQAISHGLASALSNTDQEKNREKAWYLLSKFAGERTGVFVSPFRPLKNVMDSIDKGGDKDLYDYPFAQGFERNLPKAIFFDAPEKKDSQGNPKKFNPYQYLKPFSLNVVDDTIAEPELPNLLRIKRKGSNFKYEQPVLPEELRERDARKERKAKLRTDADITEIMALPEFKKSTTDQLVSMIRSADPEEVEPLKKMLRQKVINARKAGTFTEAEAKRVNDLLGTQYKAKTEK